MIQKSENESSEQKISDKNKSDYCFYCDPIYTVFGLRKICVMLLSTAASDTLTDV